MPERFSASVAARHMACHASANLELAIPNWVPPVEDRTADNAANRGTDQHEILAKVMALKTADVRAIAKALDYVGALRSTRRFNVLIEQDIQAAWLTTKPTTQVDLVLYTQDELHVLDWKTGKIPVEAIGNEQLLYYAATFKPLAPKAKGAELHVVQPWADGCKSWFASNEVLAKFVEDAQRAESRIQAGDITFGPSDHCKFCPANPHSRGAKGAPLCPAMMQMLYPDKTDEDAILAL